MVRTPKLFLHALHLLDCTHPRTRFCVRARCVRSVPVTFGGAGQSPRHSLRSRPRCCASPRRRVPGRARLCGHGGQRGGPGRAGAAGSRPRGALGGGAALSHSPPRPPDL